jgi:hypothetical protein
MSIFERKVFEIRKEIINLVKNFAIRKWQGKHTKQHFAALKRKVKQINKHHINHQA